MKIRHLGIAASAFAMIASSAVSAAPVLPSVANFAPVAGTQLNQSARAGVHGKNSHLVGAPLFAIILGAAAAGIAAATVIAVHNSNSNHHNHGSGSNPTVSP